MAWFHSRRKKISGTVASAATGDAAAVAVKSPNIVEHGDDGLLIASDAPANRHLLNKDGVEGCRDFTSTLSELTARDPDALENNALLKRVKDDPVALQELDRLLTHVTSRVGPIQVASLGQEAVVLVFGFRDHVLRITPKNKISDEILKNKVKIEGVIQHHSVCIGKDKDIVISVVPKVTCYCDDGAKVEALYKKIRKEHFDDEKGGHLFADVKKENVGLLPDGVTPLVTDLGAIRRINRITEAFDIFDRTIDAALGRMNPDRMIPELEWKDKDDQGKDITKQEYFFGKPENSKLGRALIQAIRIAPGYKTDSEKCL